MHSHRRDQIALFSESELRSGLELAGTPESAREVAAQVYAIPADQQQYFEWVDAAVLFVSCVSDELAQRVATFFSRTPEDRRQIQEQQQEFREHVAARTYPPAAILSLDDVVFDTRTEH